MKKGMFLAIGLVGFSTLTGCVTSRGMREIVQQEIAPVRADVAATNARLDDMTDKVGTSLHNIYGDLEVMKGQIENANNLAADAGHKAGAAVLKISSVYDETRKNGTGLSSLRKETKEARAEASTAHGEISEGIKKTSEKVSEEATATRAQTKSAISADGSRTRDVIVQDGDKTREVEAVLAEETQQVVSSEAADGRDTTAQEAKKTRDVVEDQGGKTRTVVREQGHKTRDQLKKSGKMTRDVIKRENEKITSPAGTGIVDKLQKSVCSLPGVTC